MSQGGDAPAAVAAPAPAEPKKTVKVTKKEVPFTAVVPGLPHEVLAAAVALEKNLQAKDRAVEETNERKNALESYVYDMRNKLYDSYSEFITEESKAGFLKALDEIEEWLYDQGEDAERGVYVAKLAKLKQVWVSGLFSLWVKLLHASHVSCLPLSQPCYPFCLISADLCPCVSIKSPMGFLALKQFDTERMPSAVRLVILWRSGSTRCRLAARRVRA